jgi:hypothetical protein
MAPALKMATTLLPHAKDPLVFVPSPHEVDNEDLVPSPDEVLS